jgi:hypothetical protein
MFSYRRLSSTGLHLTMDRKIEDRYHTADLSKALLQRRSRYASKALLNGVHKPSHRSTSI